MLKALISKILAVIVPSFFLNWGKNAQVSLPHSICSYWLTLTICCKAPARPPSKHCSSLDWVWICIPPQRGYLLSSTLEEAEGHGGIRSREVRGAYSRQTIITRQHISGPHNSPTGALTVVSPVSIFLDSCVTSPTDFPRSSSYKLLGKLKPDWLKDYPAHPLLRIFT